VKKSLKTKVRDISKEQLKRLKELSNNSKNLYNQALYIVRKEFENSGDYLNYNKMDKVMKKTFNLENEINYKKLKAGVSQQILRKLDKNFSSFFRSISDWKNNKSKYLGMPKPPKFIKSDFYNLIYDSQRFQIKDGKAILEKNLFIKIPSQLLDKKIKQIEIIPKYGYFEAVFVFEEDKKYLQISENKNIVGIDLGLNNLATVVSNGKLKPFIINGRPLKSINQFYNKNVAKLKSNLEKRQGKKWSNKLQKVTDNRNNKIKDYLHKSSTKIVEKSVECDISTVIIGNVAKSTNKINLGKRNNQNFVNLSLGQFVEKLKYKLEAHNIKVKVVDESYTSKASFIDSDVVPKKYFADKKFSFSGKRVKRGLYKSKDGIKINADVNGAFNIIKKVVPKFTFKDLSKKVNDGIEGWFLPHIQYIY
jgi:putative transposase